MAERPVRYGVVRMSRMRILGALLVAAVALAVAGCGEDEPEVPAATQWAGDLCTAVNTWRNSISSTAASLAANPSREGLEEAADDARETTETLIDTVRGLGAPDTESGEEARETVESLADSVESNVEKIESTVEDVSGIDGVLQAVSSVSATVATISADLKSSLDQLAGLQDVDDELRQSFTDAESCNGVIPEGS